MARFVVDLGDVKLTDEEHNAMAGAIHSAVIGQLAKVSDSSVHTATKTLHRAGMGFAPADATATAKPKKAKKPA
ncbi:MAG: hypothetical protein ABS99_06925 [Acetobacteraceae bacterium SCN 69-10]|nr:hypothetical protein [Rhodospirillales bacterium]ODU55779.1 MAG: hypothetical protein ABS99_06925 [Acetobacteraceae bacterium SCN 69-10]OJY67428.1 MAG: hypothetical protein BGP12_14980 [Rhodospirillales bacterium 70-18]